MARRRDENRARRSSETIVDIPETAEIRITNDHNGRYVMSHPKLTQFKIDLDEAGAEEWVRFNEIRTYKNSHPRPFENLKLMITGVRNANKEVVYKNDAGKTTKKKVPVEIKDVVQALGLSRYYEAHINLLPTDHGDAPDGVDFSDFILKSTIEEFELKMQKAPNSFKLKIADTAAELYANLEFANKAKMDIIEKMMGGEFFDAIDYAKAYKNGILAKREMNTW